MTTTTSVWIIHPNNETTPVFTTQAAAELYATTCDGRYSDGNYYILEGSIMSLADVKRQQAKWDKLKLESEREDMH